MANVIVLGALPLHAKNKPFLLCLLAVFIATFYFNGAEGYMIGTNPYRRLEALNSQGTYILEWEVDRSAEIVTFHVTVATTGFVEFGLSNRGKIDGADIVVGGISPDGQSYFSDRHGIANNQTEEDPSQDWDLVEAWQNSTHTFLCFSRAFDTHDPFDYRIIDDKVSLIWAYGDTDNYMENPDRGRGEYPVHLIDPDYTPPIDRDETGCPTVIHSPYGEDVRLFSWTISFNVPTKETTYWCTMNKGPTLLQKHHYIGYEMRFTDEVSRKHLHHVIISKCHAPQGFTDREMFHQYWGKGQNCLGAFVRSSSLNNADGHIPLEYCTDYLTGSAVGDRISFLPPHVGTPFGETRDEYYGIQIHYDNPQLLSGLLVTVHLDIFYTPNLRENEGDLFVIRHESPGLPPSHLIPPKSKGHKNHAICGSNCTNKTIPEEGIKIHTLLLHAHNSGIGLRFRHFRNGMELPFIAAEDNFAFDYQQMRVLPEEVQVLPGDQLMIECVTDITWTNGTVVGGFSTRQEMCVVWFFYYNRLTSNMVCNSEIESTEAREYFLGIKDVKWSNDYIEYVAETPANVAGLTVTQVSNALDWTTSKRDELQEFHLNHAQQNRCPIELYARRHAIDANGNPVDLQPEENDGYLTAIPNLVVPYTRP